MDEQIDPELVVQKVTLDPSTFRFKTPCSIVISGPSQAGKSTFLYNLINFRNDVFTTRFHRIIYCLPERKLIRKKEFIDQLKLECSSIEIIGGLPSVSQLNLDVNSLPILLLVDDQMTQILKDPKMLDLMTLDGHSDNITFCFTMQNYYENSKFGKTMIRNCHYRVFFYNSIEKSYLSTISTQITNSSMFFEANFQFLFKRFPNDGSHYLVVDGQFRSKGRDFWCRSKIFPEEKGGDINPIVFYPNIYRK